MAERRRTVRRRAGNALRPPHQTGRTQERAPVVVLHVKGELDAHRARTHILSQRASPERDFDETAVRTAHESRSLSFL